MSMINCPGTAVAYVGTPVKPITWTVSTAYATGAWVYPPTRNGYVYLVTDNGGTSHTAAPTWPTTVGGTVADNDITWTCYSATDAYVLISKWVASTAYVKGDWCVPSTYTGYAYKCTTAGTTDSTEPEDWSVTEGGLTEDDGTVDWTAYKISGLDTTALIAGERGRFFFDKKNSYLYVDNGVSWIKVIV